MKTFLEVLILEEIKKIANYKELIDQRDDLLKDIHMKDIEHTKASFADRRIGVVNGITIYKSVHSTEVRDDGDGAGLVRDYGLDNEFILNIFKKLFLKPTYNPKKKTMVAYRNKRNKYDLLVITPIEGNTIKIITIIQGHKNTAREYFTPSHYNDQKAMIESVKDIEGVEDFIILD